MGNFFCRKTPIIAFKLGAFFARFTIEFFGEVGEQVNPPFIGRDVDPKHKVGVPRFFAEFVLKDHGLPGAGSRGLDFNAASFDGAVAASTSAGGFSEGAVNRGGNSKVFAQGLNHVFTGASDVVAFELCDT